MVHTALSFETKDLINLKTALISVSDKTGLEPFVRWLHQKGVSILSTGGSAQIIASWGIPVRDVSDYTEFPEMLDGRVKTLHPRIHGGLLGIPTLQHHLDAMQTHGIEKIDLLVVNLYPFEKALAQNVDFQTCIDNIDIGGPALIRAAAKNHAFVTVLVEPSSYDLLIQNSDLSGQEHACTTLSFRRERAVEALSRTASYDAAISEWMGQHSTHSRPNPYWAVGGTLKQPLRYGENPHQDACFYTSPFLQRGIAHAVQHQGKPLSYNNINDMDAAFELLDEFDATKPACVIVKHANPCGVAVADDLKTAYLRALECDPVSAFGGIIALNQMIDAEICHEITKIFTEVIIAPDATEEAKAILAEKKNLRLLLTGAFPEKPMETHHVRQVSGGFLVQNRDKIVYNTEDIRCVTHRTPTPQETEDLLFAFKVAKHVKSNAIIYAKEGRTVGIGAGQMNRRDSSHIAAQKAAEAALSAGYPHSLAQGSVVASDAFFPFADGLIAAAEAGVTAIIQPGGSVRDDEVIAAANERGLAMLFTAIRHFKH